MSSSSSSSGRTVIRRLQEDASCFELEQIYRIFRQLARKSGQKQSVKAVVRAVPRYSQQEVLSVESVRSGWAVECAAEALTGSRGVLPHYLRDASLATEVEGGDRSMGEFLALFEAPWLERVARSRVKYDLCAQTEMQCGQLRGMPPLDDLLLHLLPGGQKSSNKERDLFRFAGMFSFGRRNLEGLRLILCDYFNLRIIVRAASVRRHRIDPDALAVIGLSGKNCSLGRGAPLGLSGFLDSWRVDVLLMPRDKRQLRSTLDSDDLPRAIKKVTDLYLGDRTPSAVFVMARRRFLKRPVISSQKPQCQLGQSVCLAPERYPEGVVRIRLRV
ncbi:type VI secretion system baseplate subunit TssG [Parendozoicomonas sp. Alg238-R29]|uniref:type VI secretion system baseplate subunit TssG n=1 Tax=Parendozoicomonas sp. Alg238-R29 TaxID=2993446 RepID=UPI00248DACD7|nr:type VI secretion system baseplate subunit TssG [Parendozoicomonas sp. Alg238-R29]